MEMTKQRKMLVGVLCIGLGGLVVDRLVLTAPESAVADQEEVVVVDAPQSAEPLSGLNGLNASAQDQSPPEDTKTLPSYATLTDRLLLAQQQVHEQVPGREDPFAVPEQWQAGQHKLLVNESESETETPVKKQIMSLFKLDGTVRSLTDGKEELLAVISGGGLDGVAIRVKQRVRVPNKNGPAEEYELVEVGSRYVVWMSLRTKERVRMEVEQDY